MKIKIHLLIVQLLFSVLFSILLSLQALAAETKHENETTVFDETFSWQFMAGFSTIYSPAILKDVKQDDLIDFLSFSLQLDLYYKGFFIQSNHRRADSISLGGEMGYQLIVKDEWELDIINKTYLPGYEPENLIDDSHNDIPTLEGLDDRSSGEGLGLRYSRFYKSAILSIDVASLSINSSAKGWVAEAFYSHLVPYRNWDFYLGAGLTHYSDQVTDYYLGVDKDEISDARPYHKASSSYRAQLEVYAQYPLSKKWTFNGSITQSYYSNNITDSPLADKQHITQVALGVLYVF
jgi:outer membrane scaffolding protein for murein synthesis (MipA/OmpV family)